MTERSLLKTFRNSYLGWAGVIEAANILSQFHFPAVDGIEHVMGWASGIPYGLNAIIPALGFGTGYTLIEAWKRYRMKQKSRRIDITNI